MVLDEEYQPKTIQDARFPDAKEVKDVQFLIKDNKLYVMKDGEWYHIANLTKVT